MGATPAISPETNACLGNCGRRDTMLRTRCRGVTGAPTNGETVGTLQARRNGHWRRDDEYDRKAPLHIDQGEPPLLVRNRFHRKRKETQGPKESW